MRNVCAALAVLCLIAAIPAATVAQAKKKPQTKKPTTSSQKKPVKPPVLGTKQMSGDQAVVRTEYTLGKDDPMNIKVTRVEYRADRIRAGEYFYEPDAAHKALVVYFTFHNPQSLDRPVTGGTFKFMAVDTQGTNHDGSRTAFRPDTGSDIDLQLKPGQKMDAYTYVALPAKGDIEKLIIQSHDDRVLRYALTGKVKPLEAAYADPDDKSGCSARSECAAKVGVPFPLPLREPVYQSAFDVTVDSHTVVSEPITEDGELPEDHVNLVVSLRARLVPPSPKTALDFSGLNISARMDDGSVAEGIRELVHATGKRSVDFNLEKAAEVKFRMSIPIPKDAKPTALIIKGPFDEMRSWVIEL